MLHNDLDLTALRAFRAILREGSFSAAALTLRVPKSTLSKRIADLEASLGVRLIERTTRQLRVTQEGKVLAARADRLLGEADDIRRALGEQHAVARGHLRIAVPQVMGNVLMGKLAADFRAAHPDVTLEIHFLDRVPDLLEEGFDGCVRFGPMESSGQVARLLQEGHAVLVARPGLPDLATLDHPTGLKHLPLVGLAAPWAMTWMLNRTDEAVEIAVNPALQLGSYLAIREAAIAGAGVALLPYILARPALDAADLIAVLPGWETPRKGLYFVYPSAQSVTARLRVFIDFLACAMRPLDMTAR